MKLLQHGMLAAALLLALGAGAEGQGANRTAASLRQLERWSLEAPGRARPSAAELREFLLPLRFESGANGARLEVALCQLLATAEDHPGLEEEQRIAALAREVLQGRLAGTGGAQTRLHLEQEVLARPQTQGAEARRGAALALCASGKRAGSDVLADSTRMALLGASRDPDGRVVEAALAGLVGVRGTRPRLVEDLLESYAALEAPAPKGPPRRREQAEPRARLDRAMDRLALHESLWRAAAPKPPPGAATAKEPAGPGEAGGPGPEPADNPPQASPLPIGPGELPAELGERLWARVEADLSSDDWQRVRRAARLWSAVDGRRIAGPLVAALEAWNRRAVVERPPAPTGSGRARAELRAALEGLSGLQLGPNAERWRAWAESVAGGRELHQGTGATTRAEGFFGLELHSSAVAFVLDASGSMQAPMGTSAGGAGNTRFDSARRELLHALARSPEPVWFEVVLFSTGARRYAAEPRRSTAEELAALERWLFAQFPDGGTELGSGLGVLWPPKRSGRYDRAACDTVVVLCDGATTEDAAWARAFLARGPLEDGVVFHAVQIGGSRAEALEELTRASGGSFVRVDAP